MSKFVPESVLEKLVVDQRVRYVPTGTCDHVPERDSHAGDYGATGHEAFTNAENKTGVIVEITTRKPGHPYLVRMHNPYDFGGQRWRFITVAADELVLVEDES